jgi:hypothetical protein
MPRPLGMLEATRFALPVWEDNLPQASISDIEQAGNAVAAALVAGAASTVSAG